MPPRTLPRGFYPALLTFPRYITDAAAAERERAKASGSYKEEEAKPDDETKEEYRKIAERRVRPDVSIIAAYVVRGPGSAIGENDVLEHAASRLAAYKRPKQVIFLDALPRSASGKLLRRQLA